MAPPVVGRTIASSTAAFDPLPRPPAGAPNVVVIVLDDLGFAQLGCYGGRCETPAMPPRSKKWCCKTLSPR